MFDPSTNGSRSLIVTPVVANVICGCCVQPPIEDVQVKTLT
jgi:hypothetical protein